MTSRWNALHPTVAATLSGLLAALLLLGLRAADLAPARWALAALAHLDFSALLMRGALGFLLFAGALHLKVDEIKEEAGFIAALSTISVLLAALFVGATLHAALSCAGLAVSWLNCFLFGALISPTDPIVILAIFRRANAPRRLAVTVAAESLFNDAAAVVLFSAVLGAAIGGDGVSMSRAAGLFIGQSAGGAWLGLVLGFACRFLIAATGSLAAQIAGTCVVAFAGYALANAAGVSGLLAMIVAGAMVGNASIRLKAFWMALDDKLNLAVFFLLGLQLALISWTRSALLAGAIAVPLVLLGRAVSVGTVMAALSPWRAFEKGTFRVLTWGGLRGAIPLALALALPPGGGHDLILGATYVVGLFSLIVQGSTI